MKCPYAAGQGWGGSEEMMVVPATVVVPEEAGAGVEKVVGMWGAYNHTHTNHTNTCRARGPPVE